ncbi:MAG: hypothetical protein VB144_04150 [Clostridia bacterium]|nr:hypothetical protein [Clostridia bacterium]
MYHDLLRQVETIDELGHRAIETYDGLGRFVLAEWKDAANDSHILAHTRYDSLGGRSFWRHNSR